MPAFRLTRGSKNAFGKHQSHFLFVRLSKRLPYYDVHTRCPSTSYLPKIRPFDRLLAVWIFASYTIEYKQPDSQGESYEDASNNPQLHVRPAQLPPYISSDALKLEASIWQLKNHLPYYLNYSYIINYSYYQGKFAPFKNYFHYAIYARTHRPILVSIEYRRRRHEVHVWTHLQPPLQGLDCRHVSQSRAKRKRTANID